MTVKECIGKIAEVARKYNAAQAGVPAKVRQYNPGFDRFTAEAQATSIQQTRGFVTEDFREEVARLTREVAEAKAAIPVEIGKLKYPLCTSTDKQDRLAGELMLQSARLFLSTKPEASVLVSEVQSALELKRIDFCFGVADSATRAFPTDRRLSDEQFKISNGLSAVLSSFDTGKLSELQAELAAFPDAERLAQELARQVSASMPVLYLPDLDPLMTAQEIKASEKSPAFSITEQVLASKRRAGMPWQKV